MQRNSEFPLFLQSAIAIVSFLLFLSLVGWLTQPRGAFSNSSTNAVSMRVASARR